jgi:hypothetical protein
MVAAGRPSASTVLAYARCKLAVGGPGRGRFHAAAVARPSRLGVARVDEPLAGRGGFEPWVTTTSPVLLGDQVADKRGVYE